MNFKILTIVSVVLLLSSCQQKELVAVSEQTYHYNHQIFEENKLAPRATFFAFENSNITENGQMPQPIILLLEHIARK